MARVDLNIVDRGTPGSDWRAEDVALTADHLDEVMEQKTDNSGALNSLPTPFARFFVAKEAFRRCMEENLNPSKEAGLAYSQMVSDILDVYELLFNYKYHKNTWKRGEKLELREWNSAENLLKIKTKMPILYNSIKEYYDTDIKEKNLYFLVFTENGREKLLACSSPITGFVTPPDMDKKKVKNGGTTASVPTGEQYKDLHIRRKSGGEYFRDVKSFKDREPDFKNYMYNVIFGSDNVNAQFKAIKEFIRSYKNDTDIRNDFNMQLEHFKTDQNDNLVINGLNIMTSDEIDINSYFTDSMIKLPYRIYKESYKAVTYQNDSEDRDYDYLMPFKPEIQTLFEGNEIDSDVHINRNSVTVYLRYNGIEYQKEYAEEPFKPGQGRIYNLSAAKINFDLGLFPNILSHRKEENNYFKIIVVAADEDTEAPQFNIDEISLSFYKNSDDGFNKINEVTPEDNAQFGVWPAVVRSRQKSDEAESGTKFYELYNTSFDMIEVKVLKYSGLLFPLWKRSQPTNDTYTYAIDLGTSNTFMSRCKNDADGNPDLSKAPELFMMDTPMVNYMHDIPKDRQYSLIRRIEDSVFDKAKNKLKTEFLPAYIDGTEYKFPIRTALCGIRNKTADAKLFDNHNIAFFYEKVMANDDQNVHTDIKWDKNEELLRIFVRELLLIVKCDILQRNGDLDRTKLVWFSPLSFSGKERELYQDIWTQEPENVLCIQPTQIKQYSESEAPYYYYKKKDYIRNSDAVTVIDIGGGSTDFVYFKHNEPQMANSVHFGCDVLWGNGFIEFGNERSNGIYKRYASSLRFKRKDLEDLNECFKNVDSVKTKDIINFWLSNANNCDIIKLMRSDFKPVFIYHLTSILYYMASMYKDNGFDAPLSIVFSGNGSKYIDNFISKDDGVLKRIIDLVLEHVFGGKHSVNIKLPDERKESTCYGGLYRDPEAERVKELVYQGDTSLDYHLVGDLNKNFDSLKKSLLTKYQELAVLYKAVLDMLKREGVLDGGTDTSKYVKAAQEDMGTPLSDYYKTQVKEKHGEEDIYNDSVFFLPIINCIFEMTKK